MHNHLHPGAIFKERDMRSRIVNGIEVTTSSGDVFADLGLPDAEKLKIKADLVIEIRKAIRALGLSQQEASRRMGLPQPKGHR